MASILSRCLWWTQEVEQMQEVGHDEGDTFIDITIDTVRDPFWDRIDLEDTKSPASEDAYKPRAVPKTKRLRRSRHGAPSPSQDRIDAPVPKSWVDLTTKRLPQPGGNLQHTVSYIPHMEAFLAVALMVLAVIVLLQHLIEIYWLRQVFAGTKTSSRKATDRFDCSVTGPAATGTDMSSRRAPQHDAQPRVRRKVYVQVTPQARQYALTGGFPHREVDRRGSSDVAAWYSETARQCSSVEEDLALVREAQPHVHAWLQADSESLDAVVSQQNRSRVKKSESVSEVASVGSETSQSSASSWTLDGASKSSSSGSSLSLPLSSLPSLASQSITMSQRNRTRREQAQAHRSTTNEVKKAALTELRLEEENKALHQQVFDLLQEASELTGRSYLPILDTVLADKTLVEANIILETALRDAAIEVTRLRGQAKTRHSRKN